MILRLKYFCFNYQICEWQLPKGAVPIITGWRLISHTRTLAQYKDTAAMHCLCICFLLILLSSSSLCESGVDCSNRAAARTTSMRLKLELLCGYDRFLRPVPEHSNRTTVHLVIAPRIIQFDDHLSTFYVKTWLSMNWQDHFLSWKQEDYSNIGQFSLDTNMIWVPDLSVYNSIYDTPLDRQVSPAIVDSSGQVYVFMSPRLVGHCVPDWSNWPYDVNTCTIVLGSRKYYGSTVDFKFFNKNGIFLSYYLKNKDWELLKVTSNRNQTTVGPSNVTDSMFLVNINYTFVLRRHASVYVASYLIPGLVMVVMSLSLLWIPSDRVERVAFLCTLVVTQALYLQYLGYKIPSNGDKAPYLVCFYRDCMALTGLLIIETIVTRAMASWTSSPPTFLQTTFQFIGSYRFLQCIYMNDLDPKSAAKLLESDNDEGSTLVAPEDGTRQWRLFTTVVDKTCFIALVPIYLLLSISLLPMGYTFSIQ